jgi:hypothetical protein
MEMNNGENDMPSVKRFKAYFNSLILDESNFIIIISAPIVQSVVKRRSSTKPTHSLNPTAKHPSQLTPS